MRKRLGLVEVEAPVVVGPTSRHGEIVVLEPPADLQDGDAVKEKNNG